MAQSSRFFYGEKKLLASKKMKTEAVPGSAVTSSSQEVKVKLVKDDSTKGIHISRPTPLECYQATKHLAVLHPHIVEQNSARRLKSERNAVLDMVINTMLSQNTTDKLTRTAFANLKAAFPTWGEVVGDVTRAEDPDLEKKIEDAIHIAGLAKTRAQRIRSLVRTLAEEQQSQEPSLEHLRDMSSDAIKAELQRFKGIGPKTISCVLLFALLRPDFPVDTHVLRISKMLKWVPSSATRESAYGHLNQMVPDEVKMDLHCLLVTHGKHCHRCAANGKPQFPPKDGTKLDCPFVCSKCFVEGKIVPVKVESM